MVRKQTPNLGKGIAKEKKKLMAKMNEAWAAGRAADAAVAAAGDSSVLEQSSLDELIATVEMRKSAYSELMGDAEYVEEGPTLMSATRTFEAEQRASRRREIVSIPRRPPWHEGTSMEELAEAETAAFLEWRRGLALAAQEEGLHLTPYERNLDFWRQLWRCCERSDLLVEIVDARDPHFYHSRDLGRYVRELGNSKKLVLLVNKADFLTAEQRAKWVEYYEKCGVDVLFFSALREVRRHEKEKIANAIPRIRREVEDEEVDATDGGEQVGDESASQTIFARARREAEAEDEEDEQQLRQPKHQKEELGSTAASRSSAAALSRGVDVPVPDSDDEQEEGAGGRRSSRAATADNTDVDEEDAEAALGDLSDDDEGVLDSSRLLEELCARLPGSDSGGASSCASTTEGKLRLGTIGFVGYPNVGKSTVINALIGSKRVGMSKRPGKTKHIQTLELPQLGVTLCDCPGLVFPSVAATKAHLVINNTVPLDDLRECWSPVSLILDKVGFQQVLEHYDCAAAVQAARERSGDHVLDNTHAFLAALAVSRNHHLRVWVPDENWAARKVLRDYVSGQLLHCEPPPMEDEALAPAARIGEPACEVGAAAAGEEDEEYEEDDFGDVGDFLRESRGAKVRGMTKRKERMMNKKLLRGKAPTSAAVQPRNLPVSIDCVQARAAGRAYAP